VLKYMVGRDIGFDGSLFGRCMIVVENMRIIGVSVCDLAWVTLVGVFFHGNGNG
jgi:hypothetical protein